MKKSEMPKTINYQHEYTAFQVAAIIRKSDRTAAKLIDEGVIPGYRRKTGKQERLVRHSTIARLSLSGPFAGCLSRVTNIPE